MELVASELVYSSMWVVMILIVGTIGYRIARGHISGLVLRYRRHRVARIGVSAPARVVDVETVDPDLLLGVHDADGVSPGPTGLLYRILLMVEPPTGVPFGADIYTGLSDDELDSLRPDSTVSVMYDPQNTDIVVLGGARGTGDRLDRSSSA